MKKINLCFKGYNLFFQEKEAIIKQGFTLVELIVVITILAILGTIAFITLQGYSKDARDSVRISDIKSAETGLELFQLDAGKYPEPDNLVFYTGGTSEIKQGILGEGVVRNVKLDKILQDPLTNKNYVYSIFGKGLYYQIAADSEDTETAFIQPTYAAEPVTSIVRGNYKFDPTLPSLILVPSSVTGSGIFDPNVCFVVDGGKNTLNNCVEKKNEMSLKDFDNALVGYWDMETISGTLLKDLSGNGNNGTGSGGIIIGGTCGVLGKGTYFDGVNDYIDVGNNDVLNVDNITISIISKINRAGTDFPLNEYFLSKGKATYVPFYLTGSYDFYISNRGTNLDYLTFGFENIEEHLYLLNGATNNLIIASPLLYNSGSYYNFTITYNLKNLKTFKNGKLVSSLKLNYKMNKTIDSLLLGKNGTLTLPRWLKGNIDDLKIYNRALSDDEVLQQAKIAGF